MNRHLDPTRVAAFDRLPEAERRRVTEHAASCVDCRRALIEEDPSRWFALLVHQELPGDALEALSERIELRLDRVDRRAPVARPGLPGRWVAAAAVAAALLLAVLFGSSIDGLPTLEQPQNVIAEAAAPPITEDDLLEFLRRQTESPAVLPARGIELLSSPGDAEVVDFALGETQVVMIFDAELDI